MELGKVKKSTSELIDASVARQKAWMSRMRERSRAFMKYLSKHTVKTVQTLVAVTPIVNKLQNNEVSRQSYGKKWAYLLSVIFVLAIIVAAIWLLSNIRGCEETTTTATSEEIIIVQEEAPVAEETPEPVVQPVIEPQPETRTTTSSYRSGEYTVKAGDNLWKIAGEFMNDNYKYPDIAKYNNISNPDLIYPGQKIIIPTN